MRVPQFLLFTLGLSAMMALFGCSRESSVKENVNLKNNHSRVYGQHGRYGSRHHPRHAYSHD